MKMDVKTQLHEGMKIAPIDKQDEEYTLILSSKDDCMYGVCGMLVIKLDDLDKDELDNKWICTNLSHMNEDIKCIEFSITKWNDDYNIISFEDFCIHSFSNILDDDFESIEMRQISMKREDYLLKKGFTYEIKLREKIKDFYEKQQKEEKTMKNKIAEMFNLQNKLNIATNGKYWTNGITKDNREIDWNRCIYMETAEFIDSFNWKHWKDINAKPDLENAKIELVDIWHFIMSEMIRTRGIIESIDEAISAIDDKQLTRARYFSPVRYAEDLMLFALTKKDLLNQFVLLVNSMDDFTMENAYELYIGKNCLNQFRQDNGYKDGTYQKIKNGVEDNVVMQKYIDDNGITSYQELYDYLENEYNK